MPSKLLASTSTKSNFLIVIAHSARALAESASRAGYQVISVDGFADLDCIHVCVESWCLPLLEGEFPRDKLQACLKKLQARYPIAKVIIGAGAEPFYCFVESIVGWDISGSSSKCVASVRDPRQFFQALDTLLIEHPSVSFEPPPSESTGWLCKQSNRCGGFGVHRLSANNEFVHRCYWQRELTGVPISALCIANDADFELIGVSRQFTQALSEKLPYVYQGALANVGVSDNYHEKIVSYIDKIINYFKLTGLFSIDMLMASDEILVLEVNPRVSATYELYERLAQNANLIDAHIRVCEGERLLRWQPNEQQCGYMIVYADTNYVVPGQMQWPDWSSDCPESKRQINIGDPICSVHAEGSESSDLHGLLQARSKQILSYLKQ